jgi:signal transduction histidine kinase
VDDEATALLREAVVDIRAVVYEIRDELLGEDDGEEEEDA